MHPSDHKDSTTVKFTIIGNPVPLARPRLGKHRVYDTQSHIKLVWGIQLRNQYISPLLTGPLAIDLIFYVQAPKAKRLSYIGTYCAKRPDLDNYIKMILDVAQGIIYEDDGCVASIKATKVYDLIPRTEITVCKL